MRKKRYAVPVLAFLDYPLEPCLVVVQILSIIKAVASPFNLNRSLEKARKRLGVSSIYRRKRSDIGTFRIKEGVVRQLSELLGGEDYPGGAQILAELSGRCAEQGWTCPSRATVYKLMRKGPEKQYAAAELPPPVQAALYNLSDQGEVPGAQIVFFCFNYGTLEAMHFAAGMPWLSLYRAYRMRGWRASGQGLLRAAMRARGIPIG